MKSDFEVVDGAFEAINAHAPRHIDGSRIKLTVEPDGKTACFVTTGLKFPMGSGGVDMKAVPRKVVMFVGEIDGVRCHVTDRDGCVHVVLTRRVLKP